MERLEALRLFFVELPPRFEVPRFVELRFFVVFLEERCCFFFLVDDLPFIDCLPEKGDSVCG